MRQICHLLVVALCACVMMGSQNVGAQPEPPAPAVPCVDCDKPDRFLRPSGGFWFNPDKPGVGLALQFQGELAFGAVYTYDPDGRAQWYTFAAPLGRQGENTSTLGLTATLQRFEGGACLNCAYTEPRSVEDAGSIQLMFPQQNVAQMIIADGAPERLIPLYVGIDAAEDLPETGYPIPELTGTWVLAFRDTATELPYGQSAQLRVIGSKFVNRTADGTAFRVNFGLSEYGIRPPASVGNGTLFCGIGLPNADRTGILPPSCLLQLSTPVFETGSQSITYNVSLANIGENRIDAVSPDGRIRIQMHRLDEPLGEVPGHGTKQKALWGK